VAFRSLSAFYNATDAYAPDPSIIGFFPGILGLDFATPTADLSFDLALRHPSPLVFVELFDSGLASLGIFSADMNPATLQKARFTYSGTPVARAVIDFEDKPFGFAIDNLTFSSTSVLEPTTLALLGFGLARSGFRGVLAKVC
jgi:hypothetical protein